MSNTKKPEASKIQPPGELKMHEGRVTRVDSHGFGFIEAVDITGGAQFAFTFDQIQGYRGQQAKDMGLKEGVVVRFTAHDGLIKDVIISSGKPSSK
jgi:hypothetical protein